MTWNAAGLRALPSPVAGPAPVTPAPAPIVSASAVVTGAWSRAAASVGVGIASVVCVETLSRPDKSAPAGYEVPEPDDSDVDAAEEVIAEELRRQFPDAQVPWWMGVSFALGNLYLGCRKGRKPRAIRGGEVAAVSEVTAPTAGVSVVRPAIRRTGGNDASQG